MVLTVGNVVHIGVGISVRFSVSSVGVRQLDIRFSISFSLTLVDQVIGFGGNKGQDRGKNL